MSSTREFLPERRARMSAYIRERGAVRIDELVDEFAVSAATVRRDLEALEDEGRSRRIHGGAVSLDLRLEEPLFDDKESIATREKRAIAEKALKRIERGDTLFLDGGSTVLELARLLVDRTDITVVTNSLRAAVELSGRGPRLILTGGELRRLSQTMVGTLTRFLLDQVRVDKAFMGTMGVTLPEGMTTSDPNEAYTKELVMKRAAHVVLLVDSGKAGKISFARSGDIRNVDVLVTDKNFPTPLKKRLEKMGIEVQDV